MNIGKIAGLFFEKTESVSKEPMKQVSTPQPTVIAPPDPTGKVNEDIQKSLLEALEKANLEGFDYFEYAKALDVLKTAIPAEQTRFQTAFATAAVMGVTKAKLLDTANHYLNALKTKESEFTKVVSEKIKNDVTGLEAQLPELQKSIQVKAEQIQKLTEEINAVQAKSTEITNQISENKIKIERVQNDFASTLKIIVDKIGSDIQKIQTYLQ